VNAADDKTAGRSSFLEGIEEVSAAVEAGAGLPTVTRAASRALNASVVVLDTASSILAVACQSSEDERAVIAGERGSAAVDLRVADEVVGQMRMRAWDESAEPALLRMVTTLIGLEVHRARAPGRATEAAVGDFLGDVLGRKLTDRENIVARAGELGCDLHEGGSVALVRARPQHPEEGDWRARVLTLAERGARAVERTSLTAAVAFGPPAPNVHGEGRLSRPDRELVVLVPGRAADTAQRVAKAVLAELESGLNGYALTVALSRTSGDPADLHRAGAEALLAANVAGANGEAYLAFEETGAYRLLLPAMSEDPSELERFQEETVAPLIKYDVQYETELLRTLETFLDADGSVAKTAERLFTHRHTIRYRLDRVRELSGLDVGSTDGRERLSLGLKAMRVLGIASPGGPAREAGAEAGRVPRESNDR
jgi:sugar diacid utilization regulator